MREDKEIYKLAYQSHSNTSFSPERRAAQQVSDYFLTLDQFKEWLDKHAVDGIDKAAEFERFTENYRKALFAYLHAHSRCLSTMITGPANFPVRRAEKANASADNRMHELCEISDKAMKSIEKRIRKLAVINAGGELAMARVLLAEREKEQADMKAINKIIRSKPRNEETPEKVEKIRAILGGSEALAKKVFVPDFCGRIGFASYSLTNLNARIKSTRQRVQELEQRETTETKAIERKSGIEIIQNSEENRLQVIFPGKPSAEIRTLLKRNGFRWSPRNTAWQRQWTSNAVDALKRILPELESKKEEVTA